MKTTGYIAVCDRGGPMLSAYDPDSKMNLLYFGSHATIFKSRHLAQQAIARTIAQRPAFEQEFGRLSIKRLKPESETK